MTREHAKKLLPIITAFANGEEVQYNAGDESNPTWKTLDKPELSFDGSPSRYRIKPKPREFVISLTQNGRVYDCQPSGEIINTMGVESIIKVREIVEP